MTNPEPIDHDRRLRIAGPDPVQVTEPPTTWEEAANAWGARHIADRAAQVAARAHRAWLEEHDRELDRLHVAVTIAGLRRELAALRGEPDPPTPPTTHRPAVVDAVVDDDVDRTGWTLAEHVAELVANDPTIGERTLADELTRRTGEKVTRYRAASVLRSEVARPEGAGR